MILGFIKIYIMIFENNKSNIIQNGKIIHISKHLTYKIVRFFKE